MNRRIFSFIVSIFVVLVSFTPALAYKRNVSDIEETKVNLFPYGDFDSEYCLKFFSTTKDADISWINVGAEKSSGAVKIEQNSWHYAYIDIPQVVGETYDITFCARIDEGSKKLQVQPYFSGGGNSGTIFTSTVTSEWKKFSGSYKVSEANAVKGDVRFAIMIGELQGSRESFYLDDLKIIPRGNVKDVDYSKFVPSQAEIQQLLTDEKKIDKPEKQFSDTEGHWAKSVIDLLGANDYLNGVGNGRYAPDNAVTRAEFVEIIVNLMRLEGAEYKSAYSDVSASDWFAKSVQILAQAGVIDPVMTVGNKFKPNAPITREEAASMLTRAMKEISQTAKNGMFFADEELISGWARDDVSEAVSNGYIKGYPDDTFAPQKNITRAEAAVIMLRVISKTELLGIFVDGKNGNDENDGSIDKPLKTIQAAKKAIQPYLENMNRHLYVFIKEGTYTLKEPVVWSVNDSGQNGYSVIYSSWGSEQPVISMGDEYSNFELYDKNKNIYRTYVGTGKTAAQVYINGIRAYRAGTDVNIEGVLINGERYNSGYYLCDNTELLECSHPEDMTFIYYEAFRYCRANIKSIEKTEDGRVKITMNESHWKHQTELSYATVTYPVACENSYELLDSYGEWFLNKYDGYLYYKPRSFEDPSTMIATVPYGAMEFIIEGTNSFNKVKNITFDNLSFKYSTYMYPFTSAKGYRDAQANYSPYWGDGMKRTGGKEDAAVLITQADNIDITDCTFSHLGGAGVNFSKAITNCDLTGSEFYDISGAAINLGINYMDDSVNKMSYIEKQRIRKNNNVSNNYIHDTANEFLGACPITISWYTDTTVSHNEICGAPYSGIHVGFGWNDYVKTGTITKNLKIINNYIHETGNSDIYDGASIYTNGATGGTEDNRNLIAYNYLESHKSPYGTIYPDEGSSYWEICHNVTNQTEFGSYNRELYLWIETSHGHSIHDNYSTTAKTTYRGAPDNHYVPATVYEDANWPEDVQKIVDNAGLEAEYLKKYPDEIQRLSLLHETDKCFMNIGGKAQMKVAAYMRRLKKAELPDGVITYYSTNEDIATVDKKGEITAKGTGTCRIWAEYLDGDLIRRTSLLIISGDEVVDIESPFNEINITEGFEFTMKDSKAKTMFGKTRSIEKSTYEIEDTSVATISEEGLIKAVGKGKTVLHATFEGDGFVFKKDYPVSIIDYINEDSSKYLEQSVKLEKDNEFFNPELWTKGASKFGDGLKIANSSGCYYTNKIEDQLISFDVTINNPNGWPSFAMRNANTVQDYNLSDGTYLIGVKKDEFEFQRFNAGVRCAFFGASNLAPVSGSGRVNKLSDGKIMFEYGKRYSITIGNINESNGVRTVFIINDIPVFDYVDASNNALRDGYFGIYAFQGDFTIQPYSGLTFSK